MDAASFGLLYSLYSLPNIFVVLLGGPLADMLGYRRLAALLFAVAFVGVLLTAVAAAPAQSYILMAMGRLVFGLGNESLTVVQQSMSMMYFGPTEWMSFASGTLLTMNRLVRGRFASLSQALDKQ